MCNPNNGQLRELTSLVVRGKGGAYIRVWKVRRGNKPILTQ